MEVNQLVTRTSVPSLRAESYGSWPASARIVPTYCPIYSKAIMKYVKYAAVLNYYYDYTLAGGFVSGTID